MKNIKISVRLIVSFLIAAVLGMTVGLVGFLSLVSETLMLIISIAFFSLSLILGVLVSRSISKPMKLLVNASSRIADGDLKIDLDGIGGKNEMAELAGSLKIISLSIGQLIDDSSTVSDGAKAGDPNVRLDPSGHKGAYHDIAVALNETVYAFSQPAADLFDVVRKMSVNDFTHHLDAGKYNGALRELIININTFNAQLIDLQKILVSVSLGDFSVYNACKSVGKKSDNDELTPALISIMENIRALIEDVTGIARHAAMGELTAQKNGSRFSGEFENLFSAVNSIVQAVEMPVTEMREALECIACGDLTRSITRDYNGEYGKIKDAFNNTAEYLDDVISEINVSAEAVASDAVHLAGISQHLAQGTTEQAATVEELSSTLSIAEHQVRLNSENALKAKEISMLTRELALEGNNSMHEMINSMVLINEAAKNISKVTKTIEDIAFQTNMLSLNAAVEAARVGQYGKGFAVVADQVRILAARSANAAKETTVLVQDSISRTENGSRIADNTAEALNKIVREIEKTTTLVSEIANQSTGQIEGIQMANKGIGQVSEVVHSNTAVSEESASASEELAAQAETFKELVGRFNLRGSIRSSSRPAGKALRGRPTAIQLDGLTGDFGKY